MADPSKAAGMSREVKAGLLATGAFGCLVAGVMVKKHLAPEELLGHKPKTEQVAYEFPEKPDSENHEKDIKITEPPVSEPAAGNSGVMLASAQETPREPQGKGKEMVAPLTGGSSALPALPPLPGAVSSPPPAPTPSSSNPSSLPPLPPLPGAKTDSPVPSMPPAPSGSSAFPPLPGSPSVTPPPPLPGSPSVTPPPPLPGNPPVTPPPALPVKKTVDEPSGLPPLPPLPGSGSAFPPPPQPNLISNPAPVTSPPPTKVPDTRSMTPGAIPALPGSSNIPAFTPPPPASAAAPAFNTPAAPAFNAPAAAMPVEARVITFPSGQGPARRTEFIPAPESAVPAPFPSPTVPPPPSVPFPLPSNSPPPSATPSAPPGPAPAFGLGNNAPPSGLPTLTMPATGSNRPVITPAPISSEVVNRSIPVLTMPGSPSAPPPAPAIASTFPLPAATVPNPTGSGSITPVTATDRPATIGVISPSGITLTPSVPTTVPLASVPARPKVASWSESVHVARPGDTYPAIAEQYYRDSRLASPLYTYNRNHPRAREDAPKDGSIIPGMEIYLPDRAALNPAAGAIPASPAVRTGP